jgi:polar amino acid transport system permease protein
MSEAAAPAPAAAQGFLGETRPGDVIALMLAAVIASLVLSDWPVAVGAWFDNEIFVKYWPRLAEGLGVTLTLVAEAVVIGAILSFPLAILRYSDRGFLSKVAFGYVYFFRGTPLLAQTFLIYYGAGQFSAELQALGLWGFFKDAYWCVLLTFSLNTAAYQAEILAGAIRAVPRGQWEAAHALGLSREVAFFKIILPQAFVTGLRPYGNEVILMIKGSAVASIVTVFDLMGATRLAANRTFDEQVYLWAAVVYLMLVETLRRIWDWLERGLTRHLRQRS